MFQYPIYQETREEAVVDGGLRALGAGEYDSSSILTYLEQSGIL